MFLFADYLGRHFIEATQRIQHPGVSHPWQQLRDDIKQHVSAVANIQIASHVPLDLRFHATQAVMFSREVVEPRINSQHVDIR